MPAATVRGNALCRLLERAKALLRVNSEVSEISIAERRAAVIDLLEQYTLLPQTLDELEEVHKLWIALQRFDTANAVLQQHRDQVLQTADTPASAALQLTLWDLESRWYFDSAAGFVRLFSIDRQLRQLSLSLPKHERTRCKALWERVARQYQAWDLIEDKIDWERRQADSWNGRGQSALWRDAVACYRKAQLMRDKGDRQAVERYIKEAVGIMSAADDGDGIDFEHWHELAEVALFCAPQQIDAIAHAAQKHQECREKRRSGMSAQVAALSAVAQEIARSAHARTRQFQIAQWRARAAYTLSGGKDPDSALRLANAGYFSGPERDGVFFVENVLQWLIQAGRLDEAAVLAFDNILHQHDQVAHRGYTLAQERFETDPDMQRRLIWVLILAWSCFDKALGDLLFDEFRYLKPTTLTLDELLERARCIAPTHPMLALTEGMRYAKLFQWVKALPLLECGVLNCPQHANAVHVCTLWAARFVVLGVDDALSRPFPHSQGGGWCMCIGRMLDEESSFRAILGQGHLLPPRYVRLPLIRRYYEEGLLRFEAFFRSGRGAYKDSNLVEYSTLCNHLAVLYRVQDNAYEKAILLHHKGLAVHALGEHYDNLLSCVIAKIQLKKTPVVRDWQELISSAEQLWQVAGDYDGHDPTGYVGFVAAALDMLDRRLETTIWIERMSQWFEQLSRDVQQRQRPYYLCCLLELVRVYQKEYPGQALEYLRIQRDALEQVSRQSGSGSALSRAAQLLAEGDAIEDALALYRLALSRFREDQQWEEGRKIERAMNRWQRKLSGNLLQKYRVRWRLWE